MDTDHTAVSSGSLALKAVSLKSPDLQSNWYWYNFVKVDTRSKTWDAGCISEAGIVCSSSYRDVE